METCLSYKFDLVKGSLDTFQTVRQVTVSTHDNLQVGSKLHK